VKLEALDLLLATGRRVPGTSSVIGAGATGVVERVLLRDVTDASRAAFAAVKQTGGPQEVFAWKIARALGIDHLVPAAAQRADGSVAMRWIDGVPLDHGGILDGAQLRASLERMYLKRGMSTLDATRQARTDHELLEAFDWLIANRDRKAANALHQAAEGASYFIDQGAALRGELADVLRPRLKDRYYLPDPGTPNRITLSQDVRTIVAQRLTDDVIRDAHGALYGPPGRLRGPADELVLARARSDHQLERLLQRRDALVRNGYIEYEPVTPATRREDNIQFHQQVLTGTFDTWNGARLILPPGVAT
jgi:hypothetical protein